MSEFAHLPLAQITASLTNPRKTFDAAKLAELAEAAERISHVLAATFEEINRIVREANTRIKTATAASGARHVPQ